MLVDIDFGLSELNLLSLLVEFGVDDQALNDLFKKRQANIAHYFTVYCQAQKNILRNQSLLFSAIEDSYPAQIAKEKRKWLRERINEFEMDPQAVLRLFKRYLLNYRLRCVYKVTLIQLYQMALQFPSSKLLDALKEKDLIKYIPLESRIVAEKASVSVQLQCFRGVLLRQDQKILSKTHGTTWEIVAADIAYMAQTFNAPLFEALMRKITCIENDTAALLHSLVGCDQ